jgi:DNA-binding response OmpR family regulator
MCAQILTLLELPEDSQMIAACLTQSDHKVFSVKTFPEAIVALAFRPIDLIISDVHLENGGSVFDFLMWVKRNPATKAVPFVLFGFRRTTLARYLEDGIKIATRSLGAAKYIAMDEFDSKSFCEQIDSLLPKRERAVRAKLTDSNYPTK